MKNYKCLNHLTKGSGNNLYKLRDSDKLSYKHILTDFMIKKLENYVKTLIKKYSKIDLNEND
jgi:hypothetical protein